MSNDWPKGSGQADLRAVMVRVFTNARGEFGNPCPVVLDLDSGLSPSNRQEIAAAFGSSETVFIDCLTSPRVEFFSPRRSVPFAGHAAVGANFAIQVLRGVSPNVLHSPGGEIICSKQGSTYWVSVSRERLPAWNIEMCSSISELDSLDGASSFHTLYWTWISEDTGQIRARTFAPDWGIPEDQANGSGCMLLSSLLDRRISVAHGRGSLLYAEPANDAVLMVGGLVVWDGRISIPTRK